ncbi:MAG TPA: HAD family hydrolase [Solirubrobacteraceae bacterium]|jgi:HAD superfamily hydrolase (TIGR01509 family)|nr:HAD family hydrolase [Solirubrobacteraceae bacterium]
MARFEAVLLDYANTVVQFDRPQIESIHVALARQLSRMVAPVDARTLGAVMDRVCTQAPLSDDKRELTAPEQMRRVLQETYDRPFAPDDEIVVCADHAYQELFVASLAIDARALQALARVRARVPIGLVSNYPCGASLRRSLSTLGLVGLHPIVISGEVGYCKPHPRLFEVALQELGVPASAVLFVGDSWASDMVGAHAAGMVTCHHVGLASPADHEDRYTSYRPDYVISHLAELEAILAGR